MTTRDEEKALRELADKSTRVVAWYPHENGEVRGPCCRWFKCTQVDFQYRGRVSSIEDDVNFAAAAMNNIVPLLDTTAELRSMLDKTVNGKAEL